MCVSFHNLRWQFSSESADIGFGVFMKAKMGEWKKATEMEAVVPSQRYNAHLVPEDGSLTCERPGVCKSSLPHTQSHFFIFKHTLFDVVISSRRQLKIGYDPFLRRRF